MPDDFVLGRRELSFDDCKIANFNTCDTKSTYISMAGVYVLITSEIGYENVIIDELTAIPQTAEASKVYGSRYDIVVKILADSPEKLRKILSSIRRVEKIKSTQTMLIVKEYEDHV